MSDDDAMFIGWAETAPAPDRRFLLAASLGLIVAGAGVGAAMAQRRPGPAPASWDQGALSRQEGVLVGAPYPTLLQRDDAGAIRPMLLVGYGKVALPGSDAAPASVAFEASPILRGAQGMLAVADVEAFARMPRTPPAFDAPPVEDLGPATLLGEVLDAKCWFGAMNPGEGLSHKACASLCVRGRLPLAFCAVGGCDTADGGEISLLLNEAGEPHGPALAPLVADPVLASGQLMRRNGLLEFRVAADAIRRV